MYHRKSFELSKPYLALAAAQLYGKAQLFDEYKTRLHPLLEILAAGEPKPSQMQEDISKMFPLVDNLRLYVGITDRTQPEFYLSIKRIDGLWRLVSRNIMEVNKNKKRHSGIVVNHDTPDNAPGVLVSTTPYELHRVITGGRATTALLGDLEYPEIGRQLSHCACTALWFNAMGQHPDLELCVNINPGRVIFGINRADIPAARFTENWPLRAIRDRTYTWSKPHKFCVHADFKNHRLEMHDEIRCILPECSICTEAYLGAMDQKDAETIKELLLTRIVPFLGYQISGRNAVEVYGLAVNPEYGIADVMNFMPLQSISRDPVTKQLAPFAVSYPLLQGDQPNYVLMDSIMQTFLTESETGAAVDRFACVWRLLKRFMGVDAIESREFFNYVRDYHGWPLTDADYRLIVERRKAWKIKR
jgi:hypothetical protein